MIARTWNDLSKEQRDSFKVKLSDKLLSIKLQPTGNPEDTKVLSNRLFYMKQKIVKAIQEGAPFWNLTGPEVLDTLKIFLDDKGKLEYIQFVPIQSHNAELLEMLSLFTNTQLRIEDVSPHSRTNPL